MFYEKFTKLCISRNIAPSKVCRDLGISTTNATNWQRGSEPHKPTMMKIAQYFGVNAEYFFCDEELQQNNKIPILGAIAAGIPIDAIQDIVGYEEISAEMLSGGAEYFGLVIKGSSMEPRMYTGDVVIFRKQDDVESGEIAAVMIDGEQATVKKVEKTEDGIALVPLNPIYDVRRFTNAQIKELPITIIGRAVEVRGKL